MNIQNIPIELRDLRQWVTFNNSEKIPMNPRTDKRASSTDSSTWSTFDECVDALDRYDGVGFVLSANDPFSAVDFDHCIDGGMVDNVAEARIKKLNSYTEISPSGEGFHVWVRSPAPGEHNKKGNIEFWSENRFLTFTGNTLFPEYPATIEDRQAELKEIYDEVLGAVKQRFDKPLAKSDYDDEADYVIAKAKAAKNGAKFTTLFYGDYEAIDSGWSASEGRESLISICVPYTEDADVIREILHRSKLPMNERTLERDIQKGIDFVTSNHIDTAPLGTPGTAGSMTIPGDQIKAIVKFDGKQVPNRDVIIPIEAITMECNTVDALLEIFHKWAFFIEPYNIIAPICAAVLNFCNYEPTYFGIVGPSGSMKTEMMRVFGERDNQFVYPFSTLTQSSLISGWKANEDVIPQLQHRMIVIKDLTTLLSAKEDERNLVFAQFRELSDGFYHKPWGRGVDKFYWDINSSILFASTNAIEQFSGFNSTLGTRLMFFRPKGDPIKASLKSIENMGKETEMRQELHEATMAFIDHQHQRLQREELPELPNAMEADILNLCAFLAKVRAHVSRDWQKNIDALPEAEYPTRLFKAICSMARVHAFIHQREANDDDRDFAYRIIKDNIPLAKVKVLERMKETLRSTTMVAQFTGMSTTYTRRTLEDLHALGLIEKVAGEAEKDADFEGRKNADAWAIKKEYVGAVRTLVPLIEEYVPESVMTKFDME